MSLAPGESWDEQQIARYGFFEHYRYVASHIPAVQRRNLRLRLVAHLEELLASKQAQEPPS